MSVDKREAALNISMPFTLTLFQIIRVRQYRICSIFIQSVHNIRFIEEYLAPDHHEVVKYGLKFTAIISTTARQTSNCMQIIAYRPYSKMADTRNNLGSNT